MKYNNSLSQEFGIERGVRQGSVLSPSLFLLLMDGLLDKLTEAKAGLTLDNIYVGSMAHADDVRSLTCDPSSSERQTMVIEKFLSENFLKLNTDKCDILAHSSGSSTPNITVQVGLHSLKPVTASKCLGSWWTSDLMPHKAITENIAKARRAFFAYGSIGAFHGDLNPLSARAIVEACVMPVLLFGCESWYLTDTALDVLERFQCEIGRKILRLSHFHSNVSVRTGLDWPSIRARILIRKLSYLRKLVKSDEKKLSTQIFRTFAASDTSQLTLVQQCRYLEESYNIHVTNEIVTCPESWQDINKRVLASDKLLRLEQCHQHQSLKHLSTLVPEISWLKVWDNTLDHGVRGTKAALCLFSTLCRPLFGDRMCPCCCQTIEVNLSYLQHLTTAHAELRLGSVDELLKSIAACDPIVFDIGQNLIKTVWNHPPS